MLQLLTALSLLAMFNQITLCHKRWIVSFYYRWLIRQVLWFIKQIVLIAELTKIWRADLKWIDQISSLNYKRAITTQQQPHKHSCNQAVKMPIVQKGCKQVNWPTKSASHISLDWSTLSRPTNILYNLHFHQNMIVDTRLTSVYQLVNFLMYHKL